jgi:hypothetical protein
VQARCGPGRRLIRPYPEYAVRCLDFVTSTPPGNEGARECGVEEIDRHRIVEHPAHPGRCHCPAIRTAVLVEPSGHFGIALAEPTNCVANAGRIESGDGYKFYAEGVTPAVARLYEAINTERVAVAAALGASVPSLADWFDRVYGVRTATLVETCQRLTYNSDGPYQATGTPKSLDHKFITEDVPTGLIPMSAFGRAAGVRTPAIDALVETVRNMTGTDFAADARTLERLGLSGMDGPQIRRVMNEGFS